MTKKRRPSRIAYTLFDTLESRLLLSAATLLPIASLDGAYGTAAPVIDANGNLFGVTSAGGQFGKGSVYEIPFGSTDATVLYNFNVNALGTNPQAAIVVDSAGNIFGTASPDGDSSSPFSTSGTLWELQKSGATYTPALVKTFTSGIDYAGLTTDTHGNIYGVAARDYSSSTASSTFAFELVKSGTNYSYQDLASTADTYFSYITSLPYVDSAGNLWAGTTSGGNLLELPAGTATFVSRANLGYGYDGSTYTPIQDANGNFFSVADQNNDVFEVTAASGTQSTVTTVAFITDPAGPIVFDNAGDIIGLTVDHKLFEIAVGTTTATILHTFDATTEGLPDDYLTTDANGNVYIGTTLPDDSSGQIFELQAAQPTTQLAFDTQPSDAATGTAIDPPITVDLEKPDGTIVTTDTSAVTLSIASGPTGATLGGTTTINAVDGEGIFDDLTFSAPGTYTLLASDGTLTAATSMTFTITGNAINVPPDPTSTKLVFGAQITKGTQQTTLDPITVTVENAKSKIVTTDESSVTLSIFSGPTGSTLIGTATVAAVNGVATFNDLALSAAGKYVLVATDSSLKTVKSKSITIAPLPAVTIQYLQPPTSVTAGGAMTTSVQAELLDANGDVVTTSKGTMRLAIATGPTGGKIAGETATIKDGIATFTNLRFTIAGAYTLALSEGSLIGPTSSGFTVSPAAIKKVTFVSPPKTVAVGSGLDIYALLLDKYGNYTEEDASDFTVDVIKQPKNAQPLAVTIDSSVYQNDPSLNVTIGNIFLIGSYSLSLTAPNTSIKTTLTFTVK